MQPFEIETQLAAIAVFDGDVIQHRIRDKEDWWRRGPLEELDEIRDGRVAIASIGKHGTYRLAYVQGDPSEEAQALISGSIEGLGLVVESGKAFVGIAERLPGDGRGAWLTSIPGTGVTFDLEPGDYTVDVHVLDWRHLDDFYDEDNEILPTAPADFLVAIHPRDALDFPEPLPNLLELRHKREAKGKSSVPTGIRRRRGSATSDNEGRRRRSSAPSAPKPYVLTRPRAVVPEERAPYSEVQVRNAFDAVIDPALRHPPVKLGVRELELTPRDRSLSAKGIAIADLLKKTTTVREQMRVLEAKLNANEALPLGERVDIQLHVTRVYQSIDALLDHLAE